MSNPQDWKVRLPISTQGASDNLAWQEGRSTVNPKPLDYPPQKGRGPGLAETLRKLQEEGKVALPTATPKIAPAGDQVDLLEAGEKVSDDPAVYYNGTEALDKMVEDFGLANTITWCRMTAYKYSLRMGKKSHNPVEQEAQKIRWYLAAAERLQRTYDNPGSL